MHDIKILKETIRQMINMLLEDSKKKKRRSKPGGGLTDQGARRRIEPRAAAAAERSALVQSGGDVEAAAKIIDVSPSTLYSYIQQSSALQRTLEKEQGYEKEEDKPDFMPADKDKDRSR